jgi:non-ribosomal peptide synthetase component F
MFMLLLAAFKVLLSRYTHQSDIVIGTPIAGRSRLKVEELIGFFVNTLVLRTKLSGEESFQQLLQQVRENMLGAYTHQDLPFEKLVEELNPKRSLSHAPLFQVMFVWQQQSPEVTVNFPELMMSAGASPVAAAKFDLTLSMLETGGRIISAFEYNTDLFERETIVRLSRHYQHLLAAICQNPQQPIGSLPLLSEEERELLLTGWNQTSRAYPTACACISWWKLRWSALPMRWLSCAARSRSVIES